MLLTLDRFREIQTSHGSTDDGKVLSRIMAVESVIAGYLGFNPLSGREAPSMDRGTRVEFFDGFRVSDGLRSFRLAILPVESVTSIKADDTSSAWNTYPTTIAASDYALAAGEGRILLNPYGSTSWRRTRETSDRFYRIEYVGGWTSAKGQTYSVPEAVELAIAEVVGSTLRGGLNSPVDSSSVGGFSVQVTRRWITDEIRALLSVYRQPAAYTSGY